MSIYLNNGVVDTSELYLVYKQTIDVFDWEMDEAEIEQRGGRIHSISSCSMHETAESTIALALKNP